MHQGRTYLVSLSFYRRGLSLVDLDLGQGSQPRSKACKASAYNMFAKLRIGLTVMPPGSTRRQLDDQSQVSFSRCSYTPCEDDVLLNHNRDFTFVYPSFTCGG